MSEYTENNIDRALDWDDEISKENEYIILPEGEYNFKVTNFERAEYEGGDKIPPCKKAIIYLYIEAPNGDSTVIKENLILHTKMEFILSEFFISIGQKKHGEPLRPKWNEIIGATGRCQLKIHKWTGNNGDQYECNRVKKYLEPNQKASSAPSSGYTPGKF